MLVSTPPWWATDNGRRRLPHAVLFELMRSQYQSQEARYMAFRKYISCYEYGWRGSDRITSKEKYLDETYLFFNRAQNALDTLVSVVASPKVSPFAYCERGSWDERENAKKTSRAIQSVFDEHDLDGVFGRLAYDAGQTGNGFCKVYPDLDAGRLCVERVSPLDVLWDEAETRHGDPRCFYQRAYVDRYVARDRWGVPSKVLEGSAAKRREAIERSKMANVADGYEPSDHIIEVVEAWHLPSGYGDEEEAEDGERRKTTDGRHVICIDGYTLLDEEWVGKRFPFAVLCPKPQHIGMWGIPVMRQLASGQREAEALDLKIQRAHRRMGGSHILAPRDAKVERRQITNDVGDILEYSGQVAPHEWTPSPLNPQTYQYSEMIASNMLRFVGLNQLQSQGVNPLGANASGRALESLIDESSRYLGQWFRARERWTVDVTDLAIDAIEEIVEAKGEYSSRFVERGGYQKLDWADIVKQRDSYVIRVKPINELSISPSGKIDQLYQLLNAQVISPEEFRAQYESLDIDTENEVDLSDREIIDKTIAHMVKTGSYISPEPFDNLALIIERAGKHYNVLRRYDVAEDKLALVRQYILDAKDLMNPPAPPRAAGPGQPASGDITTPQLPDMPSDMPPGMPGPDGMPPMM